MVKQIEYIYADCSDQNKHMIFLDNKYDDYDVHDSYVVWNRIKFYGVPQDYSEDKLSKIDDGDYKEAIKIGEIYGYLILCKHILKANEDPLVICDDLDQDLEYTISALSDEGGPLNDETGNSYQNVYYIHEFIIERGYKKYKSRLIKELPGLISVLFHNPIDIISFFPTPLEYISDPDVTEKTLILAKIAQDKVDRHYSHQSFSADDKEIHFSDLYQISNDEINMVMGKRNSQS